MDAKKGRVLCVDDEPNILRSLRWLLQKEFDVEVASSGHEGLALIKQTHYDVIISDQRMPGMMGSELLREARKASPTSMRLLLTGYSDLPAILRSVNEGEVFRFINKPWKSQELLQVVGEAAAIAKAHPASDPELEPEDAGASEAGDDSILIIDDDTGVMDLVTESADPGARLAHAHNVAEAVSAFGEQKIGIVVSNMRVGNVDATRMLKMLKKEHPDVVAMVYTGSTDAVDVISLINQAQIFRFLPKPVKPTMLRMALAAASLKRRQLKADPANGRRHAVESLGEQERESLVRDVQLVAQTVRPASGDKASFMQRLGGGLLRMFGRA